VIEAELSGKKVDETSSKQWMADPEKPLERGERILTQRLVRMRMK
jgi:hypothetical protein